MPLTWFGESAGGCGSSEFCAWLILSGTRGVHVLCSVSGHVTRRHALLQAAGSADGAVVAIRLPDRFDIYPSSQTVSSAILLVKGSSANECEPSVDQDTSIQKPAPL